MTLVRSTVAVKRFSMLGDAVVRDGLIMQAARAFMFLLGTRPAAPMPSCG